MVLTKLEIFRDWGMLGEMRGGLSESWEDEGFNNYLPDWIGAEGERICKRSKKECEK